MYICFINNNDVLRFSLDLRILEIKFCNWCPFIQLRLFYIVCCMAQIISQKGFDIFYYKAHMNNYMEVLPIARVSFPNEL